MRDLACMKPDKVQEISQLWHEAIKAAELDPLRNGDHFDHWFDATGELEDPEIDTLLVSGGNRSSKTSLASFIVVNALLENPGTKIFCWSQTKDTSQLVQQPRVYQMLPPEFKKRTDSFQYKIASGFVGDKFTLPNGSSCHFRTYSQYILNTSLMEGIELGWMKYGEDPAYLNLGNWFDEYLIEPSLMRTIDERLSTRNAKNLTTFTPIKQYTETVEELLDGMETIISQKTLPDDPPQIRDMEIPYIQRCANRSVIYFPTHKNLYHNYDRSKRNQNGKPKEWALMKLYGVPTKSNSSRFPRFDKDVHVAKRPSPKSKRFMFCVPAGDRPWYMAWVSVCPKGRACVYKEWPREDEEGKWAERKEGDWAWGEAVRGPDYGMGFSDYADLIRRMDGGDEVEARFVNEDLYDTLHGVSDHGIYFGTVEVEDDQEGTQLIHNMMAYSKKDPPRLKVAEKCKNMITSITGYDVPPGKSTKVHPCQAPIDCLMAIAYSHVDKAHNPIAHRRHQGGY